MNRCRVCCGPLAENEDGYHPLCADRLFGVRAAPRLSFTWDTLNEMAEKTVRRSVAVPGVQPKLSVHLERAAGSGPGRFTLVGLEGELILKPPSAKYPEMPELEHACMRMASCAGIETAVCGLAILASGESAYLTRRMDRVDGRPLHMEDTCQLTDRMTEEKYRGSMERIGRAVLSFSSNPGFDAVRLFEVALFSFITGNADMHLKNFSLLYEPDGMIRLAPAYDLLPTHLLIPEDREEMALTVNGRKSNLHRGDFDAFAATMKLSDRQIANTHDRLRSGLEASGAVVSESFLSRPMQHAFLELIAERSARLWGGNEGELPRPAPPE